MLTPITPMMMNRMFLCANSERSTTNCVMAGQLAAEVLEHLLEDGDDEEKHCHRCQYDNDENDHGVHHRAFYLGVEGCAAFKVVCEPAEDGVEDTALLAGGDHVAVELVEHLRVLCKGLGEGSALFHLVGYVGDDVFEDAVVLLPARI